jgi:5-methylcytosine-specific restriction endonuclease McrA
VETRVVVLNADYTFLNFIDVHEAVILLYKKVAEPVANFVDGTIKIVKTFRSINDKIVVPAIIRLTKYVRAVYRKEVPWSKRNVYLRDNYTCQYTGVKLKPEEATIDHIVPRSRGGKSNFDNCVTCSKEINQRKGDKTPAEAGLTLLRRPYHPTINEFLQLQIRQRGIEPVLKELGIL